MMITYGNYTIPVSGVRWHRSVNGGIVFNLATPTVTADDEPKPKADPMLTMKQLQDLMTPYIAEVITLCNTAPEMAATLGTVNEPILHDYLREKCGADGEALAAKLMARWEAKRKATDNPS